MFRWLCTIPIDFLENNSPYQLFSLPNACNIFEMCKTKYKKLRNSQKCVLVLFVRHFLRSTTKFCPKSGGEDAASAGASAHLSALCYSTPTAQTLIDHLGNGEKQSAVFVDASTWLRWHFRLFRPFALSFTSLKNFSSDGFFTRICFVRPLPFALPNFQSAILSPFLAFNLFGISSIGNGMIKVFLEKAICVESIEFAPTVHVKLIEHRDKKLPFECSVEPEKELADFFQSPKLVYEGDLFDVSTNPRSSRIYKATFPPSAGDDAPQVQLVQRGVSRCLEDLSPSSAASSKCPFHGRYPQLPNLASHHFLPFAVRELACKLTKIFFPLFAVENECKTNPLILLQSNFEGSKLTLERVCCQLDVRLTMIDCFEMLLNEEGGQSPEKNVEQKFKDVRECAPCVCWVRNVEVLFGDEGTSTQRQDLLHTFILCLLNASKCPSEIRWPSVFCLNISPLFNVSEVPERLAKAFHWEFRLEEGDERMGAEERTEFAKWALREGPMGTSGETQFVNKIVEITKGFSLLQLIKLFDDVQSIAIDGHEQHLQSFSFSNLPCLGIGHFKLALKRWASSSKRRDGGCSDVDMDDIGGLDEAKQLLAEALAELVQEHSSSSSEGAQYANRLRRRTGILLHGPPGCGKTMLAKAVANQAGLSFVSVKGPELLSQFVGESEQNLRQVFAKARRTAPSVLFFDELDSLVPARGGTADSGGVMGRMVSQFLTELDACHWSRNKSVFIMGATNRPDLLDPCLLSPGRFDKLVPINPATDLKTKERILTSLCKKIKLADGFSISKIAQKCAETMSGAELAGLVTTASMNRLRELIETAELEGKSDSQMAAQADFALSERHFDSALSEAQNWLHSK